MIIWSAHWVIFDSNTFDLKGPYALQSSLQFHLPSSDFVLITLRINLREWAPSRLTQETKLLRLELFSKSSIFSSKGRLKTGYFPMDISKLRFKFYFSIDFNCLHFTLHQVNSTDSAMSVIATFIDSSLSSIFKMHSLSIVNCAGTDYKLANCSIIASSLFSIVFFFFLIYLVQAYKTSNLKYLYTEYFKSQVQTAYLFDLSNVVLLFITKIRIFL